MRFSFQKSFGRLAGLVLVTLLASAVMLASIYSPEQAQTRSVAGVKKESRAPVKVRKLEQETVDIVDVQSGMIRPFERFTLSFEIGGRIESLGISSSGTPLDEGDEIKAGDILAVLDQRAFKAQVVSARAQLFNAKEEFERGKSLQLRNPNAISDAELLRRETQVASTQAQLDLAEKSLEDATLIAPTDGVISRRMVNAGESINPHQAVFEIVQVDRLLLVVAVPESKIGPYTTRQREVAARRKEARRLDQLQSSHGRILRGNYWPYPLQCRSDLDPTARWFKVGAELFGQEDGSPRSGEVFQIAETSDDRSGLFEVEIALPNADGRLKPGQIAVANIATKEIEGFRINSASALFRGEGTFLYAVAGEETPIRSLFWEVGKGKEYRAQRLELPDDEFLEQGENLVLFDLPRQSRSAVIRGQHRLVDDRPVMITVE